ncbi:MAG: hypothetical protein COA50_14745 [Flavobacteriaceae bacterium]|nr:MAG: hypothetical protein COA50_14745 [Flavobacteriaceae bacterium]
MNRNVKKGILLGIVYVIFKWTILGVLGAYLYKNELWSNWYLFTLPAIGITVFLIRKRKNSKNNQ